MKQQPGGDFEVIRLVHDDCQDIQCKAVTWADGPNRSNRLAINVALVAFAVGKPAAGTRRIIRRSPLDEWRQRALLIRNAVAPTSRGRLPGPILAPAALTQWRSGMSVARSRQFADFTQASGLAGWEPVDDVVMGGVSRSALVFIPAGFAEFRGQLSLENSGGFASVRSAVADFGLAGATTVELDVRGDGRRYKLNLRNDDAYDGINYQSVFMPASNVWQRIELPLSGFTPRFRGRTLDAPPLDPAGIRRVGLLISDCQAGPFVLAVRTIRVR